MKTNFMGSLKNVPAQNQFSPKSLKGAIMIKSNALGFLLFIIICLSASVKIHSQDKINQAYNNFYSGNFSKAEQLFLSESKTSNAFRANVGLYYLYNVKLEVDKIVEYCNKTIESADKPEPYIYALTGDEIYLTRVTKKESGLLYWLKNASKNNKDGLIKAVACERLGNLYLNNNEFKKAEYYFNQIGALKDWSVIGPFGNISALGYYHKYGPEEEFNPNNIYTGKDSMRVHWFNIDRMRKDYWINFKNYFQTNNSVFYGNTFVYSPKEQTAEIRIGVSGSYRAFLNDHLISEKFEERNTELDAYVIKTTLPKGWNRLLIKVGYSDINYCNLLVRITNDKGFPLNDLKYSAASKNYNHNSDVKATLISSSYEKYFEEKIKKHPNNIENYILLSQFYLSNENLDKAEELLQNILKKNPDNLMVMYALLSFYSKERNITQLYNISEKICDIKNDIPEALFLRLMHAEKNHEREKFISIYERMMSSVPESPELYELKSAYYLLKEKTHKLIETINEGYKKYPDVWNIVSLKEWLETYLSRDNTKVLRLISKYCKNNYSFDAYKELADLYLTLSDFNKWESTYYQIIDHNPAEPEYHYQMAKVYMSLKKYEKAKQAMKEAIHICPFNSTYYETLGDIYQDLFSPSAAVKAYKSSIKYSIANYSARRKLKLLEAD